MSSSGFDSSALDRVNYSQLLAEYTQELQNQHSVNPASSSMMSYKTKMCKAMLDKGECPFKDLCTFAHTNEELRIAVPIPVGILRRHLNLKYKTKLCNKFHNFGACPYGDRCLFIHEVSGSSQHKRVASTGGCECGHAHPLELLFGLQTNNSANPWTSPDASDACSLSSAAIPDLRPNFGSVRRDPGAIGSHIKRKDAFSDEEISRLLSRIDAL